MRSPTWVVRTDDTYPPLTEVLGRDLSGASVVGTVRTWSGNEVHAAAADITDAATGAVSMPLDPAVTAEPGLYNVSWTVVPPDLSQQTFRAADRSWLVVSAFAADGSAAS